MQFTSSGHYAIPLNDYHKDWKLSIDASKFTEVMLTVDNTEKKKSNKEKQQIAMKLDMRSGHPES